MSGVRVCCRQVLVNVIVRGFEAKGVKMTAEPR
jgi:hypothetical protein